MIRNKRRVERQILILSAVMLAFAALLIPALGQKPVKAEAEIYWLVGKVTAVSPLWTGNGDGSITVDDTPVLIVGSPKAGSDEPTTFKLKHRYVVDLIGHRVLVKGTRRDNAIVARVIEEL
jgi:hypothetical protein